VTFVTAKNPTQRAAVQNKKIKKTPTPTTTTHGRELDQNPADCKNNPSSQCPDQQKI
jgi:hypothetical protein